MSRRALLVGINAYADPANDLRGCLNDVRQMRRVLGEHFGFRAGAGSMRELLDARADGAALRAGLVWLVDGAAVGDALVFHYSGHGSQVADRNGDERLDGLDEIICPHDMDWSDPFTDDELGAIAGRVPRGAHLTVVLDCCHAGTGLREIPAPAARRPANGAPPSLVRYMLPPASLLVPPRSPAASRTGSFERRLRRFGRRAAAAGAVLIAACRDDQVSADAFIGGDYHGALTYYLCEALAESRFEATYDELVDEVRRLLRLNGFDQVPQLEGPRDLQHAPAFSPGRMVVGR